MENLPTFYVGQKVVCINPRAEYLKDRVYVILNLTQCPKCKNWQVGAIPHGLKSGRYSCHQCNIILPRSEYIMVNASRFAPITENFESISYEKVMETESKLIGVN